MYKSIEDIYIWREKEPEGFVNSDYFWVVWLSCFYIVGLGGVVFQFIHIIEFFNSDHAFIA